LREAYLVTGIALGSAYDAVHADEKSDSKVKMFGKAFICGMGGGRCALIFSTAPKSVGAIAIATTGYFAKFKKK